MHTHIYIYIYIYMNDYRCTMIDRLSKMFCWLVVLVVKFLFLVMQCTATIGAITTSPDQ